MGVGASSAEGFIGESAVIKPGLPPSITGPAKTIITNPTFLPGAVGESAAAAGAAEAGATAGVASSVGILPALGVSVLGLGVGVGIGSEICGALGIEGCWFIEQDEEYSGPLTPGEWVFFEGSPPGSGIPAYAYYYRFPGLVYAAQVQGQGGIPMGNPCGGTAPAGVTAWYQSAETGGCTIEEKSVEVHRFFAMRSTLEGRHMGYHATDDPGMENVPFTAHPEWETKLAEKLAEAPEGSAAAKLGQKIASEIPGSEIKNPYADYVAVPGCNGLTWADCADVLEEAGLEPVRDELDWQTAELDIDPDGVLELVPAAGEELIKGGKVTVTTNPDESGMPLTIPAPGPHESWEEFTAKLAPGLEPKKNPLTDNTLDPSRGPDEVVRTDPGDGTRLDPDAAPHQVRVDVNPTDAPPAAGAWTAPVVPAVDLSPLSGVAIECDMFPFGVFCWIADGLGNWNSSGTCPSFAVPFYSEIRDSEDHLVFDTCTFEPAMVIIRPVIIILSFFGVAWLLAASAMGLGSGSEAD
jgi:hypothetical protein